MKPEWENDMERLKPEHEKDLKNAREKRYRDTHREQENERWRRWAEANPERLKELREKKKSELTDEEKAALREKDRLRKREERARKRALQPPKPRKAKKAAHTPAYYPQEALGSVVLLHGQEVDFASAWAHTDADLRERILTQQPSATDQELLDTYCLLHMERYGEPFDF